MTASIQNTNSALHILARTIDALRTVHGAPPVANKEWHLAVLMDSVRKCVISLAAQLRFYQSAKCTGRALIVEQDDGTCTVVDGQSVEALRLPLPNLQQDAVIYGRPDTLAAVAAALGAAGWPAAGPAPIHELARQLAAAATPPDPMEADSHA